MPRGRRIGPARIHAEVVLLGLDPERLVERGGEVGLRRVRAQRGAQIDLLAPAKAGIELAGGGHPQAVAAGAEIVGVGRDEAEPATGLGNVDIVRRAAGGVVVVGHRPALLQAFANRIEREILI